MPLNKYLFSNIELRALKEIASFRDEAFEKINQEKSIYIKHKKSNCYFRVGKEFEAKNIASGSNSVNKIATSYSPKDSASTQVCHLWTDNRSINAHFDKWVKLVKEKDEMSEFDDPIIAEYARENFLEFKISDDDESANKPLPMKYNLVLAGYLEIIENRIEEFKEDDKLLVEEIKNDAAEIKSALTKSTKKEIAKKFSVLWGKISTLGIDAYKMFVDTAKKELIKMAVNKGIKKLPEAAEFINELLN